MITTIRVLADLDETTELHQFTPTQLLHDRSSSAAILSMTSETPLSLEMVTSTLTEPTPLATSS